MGAHEEHGTIRGAQNLVRHSIQRLNPEYRGDQNEVTLENAVYAPHYQPPEPKPRAGRQSATHLQ
jgi:hypothetical protein